MHDNSLIKIAIIKENIDKWIDYGKLNYYDYIFTTKDFYILLKNKNYNIITLEGKSVFSHIKNILNELFNRKADKFYYFLKKTNFDNIFPNFENYFVILDSPYFDGEWYKNKYDIEDNTDPVIHYMLIGFKKGYDPGPNFSTNEYYDFNSDIKRVNMIPIVHYELYGRKENRKMGFSKDEKKERYLLIFNSPYFDKEWYVKNYDISDSDLDPVIHYLKIGYKKGYNPGPDFNTNEYFEANPDVKIANMNPLLHYEEYGKKENRLLKYSQKDYEKMFLTISNSPYFNEKWYVKNYDISDSDLDPVNHYLKIGYKKGFNPGPDFNTSEYLELHPDVKNLGLNPLLYHELYGRNENRKIH